MVNEPQFARLAEAITLTYRLVPEFRPLADIAAWQRTAVHWGDLRGAVGAYYRQTNTIVIDRKLQNASLALLGSTIAHEANHAADRYINQYENTSGDCMLTEIRSMEIDALTWHYLQSYRSRTNDPLEQMQDELLKAYQQGRLAALVMNLEVYQVHCGFCRE